MRCIATYTDYRRALRAVDHLARNGYDPSEVRLAAGDRDTRRVAPPVLLGRRVGRWAARSAAAGLVLGAAGAMLAGAWWLAPAAAVLIALGAVAIALVIRLARVAANGRRRIVVTEYHVLAEREPDRAEHLLARWWDDSLSGPPRTATGERILS